MTSQQKTELENLDKHIVEIQKTWPNIQIFVNRETGAEEMSIGMDMGNTVWISRGVGNWFARKGQVRDWLVGENESERMAQRNHEPEDLE